jgi:hypothetical protein
MDQSWLSPAFYGHYGASHLAPKLLTNSKQCFAKGQVDRTKKNYHYFDMLQQQSQHSQNYRNLTSNQEMIIRGEMIMSQLFPHAIKEIGIVV